jgi:hypothetical protein
VCSSDLKELIWTSNDINSYSTAQLKLNGHDRFAAQEEEYFQLRQPYQFHTAIPGQNLPLVFASTHATFVDVSVLAKGPTADDSDSDTEAGPYAEPTANTFAAVDFPASGPGLIGLGDVIVSRGGTGEPLSEVTATVTLKSTAETPTTAIFSFAAGAVTEVPNEGDEVLITVSGTDSASVDSSSVVIHTHITQVHSGALKGGLTNAGNMHFQFDDTLLNRAVLGAEIDSAAIFSITGFKVRSGEGGYGLCRTSKMNKKINVYSFGLKPEEHQPSGTCNFSRIDIAILDTTSALISTDNIYAVNYNVLRIMSGMGGLAYSN